MTGMQWHERDTSDGSAVGSWCEFGMGDGLPASRMDVCEIVGHGWEWSVTLYPSQYKHRASGYGCATESKAKHMAMHLVAALLQILDGVKPHEVD